ncbi:cell cycle checkpoint control protein RAD9A-like isoform X1 [Vespa mandarinia]|uniref:cell cycle checkpoint control protein RAD9A-like isoform X1 n=3 Tax=Vespa mandarinia TaxID=7446 RepID=UPI0016180C47|nr:cell cycle checkpoint control protein RAD9A-like isoform X1 [Vespa mandarinia]
MKCVIPGGNVKIVAKAIHALAKIGDEMYVQPQPNSLSFRAINMANSAYADFTFFENYFSYYVFDDLEEDDALKCKISMRSAMTVFKTPNMIDKQVETCHIELKPNADFLFITLKYKNSIIKKHILPIIDSEKLQATYIKDSATNQLSAQSVILGDAIQNFQQNLIEITLEILPQKVLLRNYIDDTSNIANVTRTQLVLGRGEFDRYSVNTETTITFCMKELKAILNFAEFVKLPINMYLESAGKPAVFVLKNSTLEVNLVLSTLNTEIDSQSETTVTEKAVKPIRKRATVKRSTKRSSKSSNRTNNTSFSNTTIISKQKKSSDIKIGKEVTNNDARVSSKEHNQNDIVTDANTSSTNDIFSKPNVSNNEKKLAHNIFSNILKRKSGEGCTKYLDNVAGEKNNDELENTVPKSPSPPSKKARFIFRKCFQTTFDPRMLPGHDTILVEDSDENSE